MFRMASKPTLKGKDSSRLDAQSLEDEKVRCKMMA
jgi:hypothetical protein